MHLGTLVSWNVIYKSKQNKFQRFPSRFRIHDVVLEKTEQTPWDRWPGKMVRMLRTSCQKRHLQGSGWAEPRSSGNVLASSRSEIESFARTSNESMMVETFLRKRSWITWSRRRQPHNLLQNLQKHLPSEYQPTDCCPLTVRKIFPDSVNLSSASETTKNHFPNFGLSGSLETVTFDEQLKYWR